MNMPLPNDVQSLKNLCFELHSEVEGLRKLLRLKARHQFGASSEKFDHPGMNPLFDEVQQETESVGYEPDEDKSRRSSNSDKPAKNPAKRAPWPDELARNDIYLDLKKEEKCCEHCQSELVKVGEKSSEKLHIIPASFSVNRYIRPLYSCKKCEICVQAAMPASPIPKCTITPESMAHILTAKFVDAMPFDRMEKKLARDGIDYSRTNMANLSMKIAEILAPLHELLHQRLLDGRIVGMDETSKQVLRERGRRPDQKGYMFVQGRESTAGDNIVVFHYEPSRSSHHIGRYLKDFKGFLLSDGLGVYDSLCSHHQQITHFGCWAHARRPFVDAIKGKGKGKSQESVAGQILLLIGRLYAIEKQLKGRPPDEISRCRDQESRAIVQKIKDLCDEKIDRVPAKSLTGKGLHYLQRQWPKLIRFLDHPEVSIDNNFIERQIKTFVIGRKNWLFSTSIEGARASAVFYSLLTTARLNGINPYKYLCNVLRNITTETNLEALLPIKS